MQIKVAELLILSCITRFGVQYRYARKLGRLSAMTETQIESLQLYRRVLRGEISSKEAANLRTPHPVKLGTYHRVLHQALRNLQSAIWTVIVGLNLGLVRAEELKRLIEVLPENLEPDEAHQEELLDVIRAIVRRVVIE